jgi:hypothetical protein
MLEKEPIACHGCWSAASCTVSVCLLDHPYRVSVSGCWWLSTVRWRWLWRWRKCTKYVTQDFLTADTTFYIELLFQTSDKSFLERDHSVVTDWPKESKGVKKLRGELRNFERLYPPTRRELV